MDTLLVAVLATFVLAFVAMYVTFIEQGWQWGCITIVLSLTFVFLCLNYMESRDEKISTELTSNTEKVLVAEIQHYSDTGRYIGEPDLKAENPDIDLGLVKNLNVGERAFILETEFDRSSMTVLVEGGTVFEVKCDRVEPCPSARDLSHRILESLEGPVR